MNTRSQVNEDGSTPMCSWIARSITEGYPAKADCCWNRSSSIRPSETNPACYIALLRRFDAFYWGGVAMCPRLLGRKLAVATLVFATTALAQDADTGEEEAAEDDSAPVAEQE